MRPFALLLSLLAACGATPLHEKTIEPPAPAPVPAPLPDLMPAVQRELAGLDPTVQAAVWLSAPLGPPRVAIAADKPLPVASAIKTAYLVELFGAFPATLDQPLPGAERLFTDRQHIAIAHFPADAQDRAAAALANATVRRIGDAMINGTGVDNATYNIAANLVTAHFGGPRQLQQRLHARHLTWRGFEVNRYMLADRGEAGDNLATARSLAAVLGMLANGAVPGVDPVATKSTRDILARGVDSTGRARFAKSGALDSDPITRVRSGWREGRDGTLVHVVMLVQPGVAPAATEAAGRALDLAAARIEAVLCGETGF